MRHIIYYYAEELEDAIHDHFTEVLNSALEAAEATALLTIQDDPYVAYTDLMQDFATGIREYLDLNL